MITGQRVIEISPKFSVFFGITAHYFHSKNKKKKKRKKKIKNALKEKDSLIFTKIGSV
jgi:hypothetical protein